jgi:hypothetical protein
MKFGELTVLCRRGSTRSGQVAWDCICSCGKTKTVASASLRGGHTKTCGCRTGSLEVRSLQLEKVHKDNVKPEAPFNYVWSQYKSCAKKKKRKFELTRAAFNLLIQSNCYWCGLEPDKECTSDGGHKLKFNGIDRLDSSIGYLEGNCVPCCTRCNVAKNNMTPSDFKTWIWRVYAHLWRTRSDTKQSLCS